MSGCVLLQTGHLARAGENPKPSLFVSQVEIGLSLAGFSSVLTTIDMLIAAFDASDHFLPGLLICDCGFSQIDREI